MSALSKAEKKLRLARKEKMALRSKISLLDGQYREQRRLLMDASWRADHKVWEAMHELQENGYTPGQVHSMDILARKKAA